jgi:uncharacterized protein (TIGR03083 family)
MDRTAYLSHLRTDAAALLAAAERGLDADVPSCPRWTVERLVGHVGRVYRWTAGWVTSGESQTGLERPPAGNAVIDWTARGLDELVAVLESDDREGTVRTWAGEQPVGFWPRRMAIETALHRWDAEAAHGLAGAIDAQLAVDGIDELLDVLMAEWAAPDVLTGSGETLHLHATDVEGEWLVTLTGGRPAVERTHAKGDVAVQGPESDLLLLL